MELQETGCLAHHQAAFAVSHATVVLLAWVSTNQSESRYSRGIVKVSVLSPFVQIKLEEIGTFHVRNLAVCILCVEVSSSSKRWLTSQKDTSD